MAAPKAIVVQGDPSGEPVIVTPLAGSSSQVEGKQAVGALPSSNPIMVGFKKLGTTFIEYLTGTLYPRVEGPVNETDTLVGNQGFPVFARRQSNNAPYWLDVHNGIPVYNDFGLVTRICGHVAGGFPLQLVDITAVTLLRNGSCGLNSLVVINAQAALTAYVQFFDAAVAGVTLGTTVPKLQVIVPAGQNAIVPLTPFGLNFVTACSVCPTTTKGGATPSAAGVDVYANFNL